MRAEGAHIGYLCWDFGSLQSLSSFDTGSAKEPGKAFGLQEEMDCFRADRLAFAQKDLLNLTDGVVLFPESNDALLALAGGGARVLRTSCEREEERLEQAVKLCASPGRAGGLPIIITRSDPAGRSKSLRFFTTRDNPCSS